MSLIYYFPIALISILIIRLLFRKQLDLPTYEGPLLTTSTPLENLLPENQFWEIIGMTSRKSNRNYLLQCDLLTQHLKTLTTEELIQFNRTFRVLLARSYSFRLWEAAYALNGGCSDDAFEYFRSWLIAQGKNKFYQTLHHPRLLFLVGVKEMIESYEGLSICAYTVYHDRTGTNFPDTTDISYVDGGEMFKEGEAFLRYPELALLAW